MARINLSGMGVALITPFKEDESIDFEALSRLIEYLIQNGTDYLVVLGTTAETPTLTEEEKTEIKRFVVERTKGRIPLVLGLGGNNTRGIIDHLKKDDFSGYDAILSVVPYYNKPSQEGIYQHYSAIAQASKLPIILYNIPGRCGTNLLPETVVRLANEVPNIVAIKEASGNLDQIARLKTMVPADFAIYSGDDSLTLPILSIGGAGVISVVAHVAGKDLRRMVDAYFDGRVNEAREINRKLYDIFKTMFITSNPVPVKYALNELGIKVGGVRLPLYEANEAEKTKIKASLSALGLL